MVRIKPLDPRLLREAGAARWFIAGVVALALLGTLSTITCAWQVSAFIAGADFANLGLAFLAGAIKASTFFGQEYFSSKAAISVKVQLRRKAYFSIAKSSRSWRTSQNSSELNLLLTSGLDSLDSYFSKYVPQLFYTIFAIPIFVAMISIQDPISGLVLVVTLPLIPIFMVFIGWATSRVQSQQLHELTRLSRHFQEAVRGLTTLRVFGRAQRQVSILRELSESHRIRTMKVLSLSFLSGFALELIASLSVALIAVSIGLRLIDGELSFATGLLVLILAPDAFMPLRVIGSNFHSSADGIAAIQRIFELFDSSAASNRIEPMLVPVKGKIIVITGPSGSGKSTALRTLLGDKSAWLPQAHTVFPGTVKQNIVGMNEYDINEQALEKAQIASALDDLDLNSHVGSLEIGLSGGQAQRLALARAIYRLLTKNCTTLLLDEPTSAQDPTRIKHIGNALVELAKEGYAIVSVSHQRSLVEFADEELEFVDA